MKIIGEVKSIAVVIVFALVIFKLQDAFAVNDISFDLRPVNSTSSTNTVRISFTGKQYINDLWFDDITKNNLSLDADERFVFNLIAANATGTQTELLNLWAPDERSSISEIISDNEIYTLNKNRYKQIQNSIFLAKIDFGEYTVFFMQHVFNEITSIVKTYTIKKVNDNFYLTGALGSDPIYNYVMMSYRGTLPQKKKSDSVIMYYGHVT